MTWTQGAIKVLIQKAHERWGVKHHYWCRLCKKETRSTLELSPSYETAYMICTDCRVARAPLELVIR